MRIVVLGATGGTGRHVVEQALLRGFHVRALARRPARAEFASSGRLEVVRADVHDAASVVSAIDADDVLISALGPRSRSEASTLVAGATAAVEAGARRTVWMGAAGTGASAITTSAFTTKFLRTGMRAEYHAKVFADNKILGAGGVVVHVGLLRTKPDDQSLGLVPVEHVVHSFWPTGAPRASVARLLLDKAVADSVEPGLYMVRNSTVPAPPDNSRRRR